MIHVKREESSSDVQDAIDELNIEKIPYAGASGDVNLNGKYIANLPKLVLKNNTPEDGDCGRESEIIFEGIQSGSELSTLGKIEVAHDGVSDDQKGIMSFKVNEGDNDNAPTTQMTIDNNGKTYLRGRLKLATRSLIVPPESGTLEYDGTKFYITNNGKHKAIDRTSDVVLSTVTVTNTVTETTLWTGEMAANSLEAGNVLRLSANGVISNGGAYEDDEVTVRIKVGGVTKATLSPNTKTLAASTPWHIEANATQRSIGEVGQRAIHIHMSIGDPSSTGDEVRVVGVATIDTTANMDVTITAEWATADPANTISIYQGCMSYRN